ncbi:hypothetical protein BJ508DRAFT_367794 [Ascobolus immersus RN42]|uniref:Uncharacterized protein n=1 Tax=Ascobolus immersus RN42 TaxID=1160509 RepID=A0A3N4HNW6_ASCIM|nr:hypothetical protein BJ508DRAFT_367794 [Ascobolus immersus RN42]
MMPDYPSLRSGASTPREPPSSSLLEKYFLDEAKKAASNGSRFDLESPSRLRPPAATDMADSMSLHLLVSTAILDSSTYEILSFDEVEALKSELSFINSRMDAARRKLVLESKVRDAAQSLGRLRSRKPGSRGNDSRTSIGSASSLGPSSPGPGSPRSRRIDDVISPTAADDEGLVAAQRKCDSIAADLWSLQLRSWEVQRRLMQHDAGVLGMTHNGQTTTTPALKGGILSQPNQVAQRDGMMSPVSEDGFGSKRGSSSYGEEARNGGAAVLDPEVEKTIDQLTQRLKQRIARTGPLPANLQGEKTGVKEKLKDLEEGLRFLEDHPAPAPPAAVSPGATEAQEKLERTNYVLSNLWTMLLDGEHQVRRKREQEVSDPTDYELSDYDSGEDDDEELEFSEEVFAAKVEILHNKALRLRDAKKTLERKISDERRRFEEKIERITEESDEKVDELKVDLKDLEYQVELLTKEKAAGTAADGKVDDEKVKKLVAELEQVKKQREEVEEDLAEAMKLLSSEQEQVETMRVQLEEAEEQMEELREDLGMAHDKSDGIAAERDALKTKLVEAEKRCEQLGDELLGMEEKQARLAEELYAAQALVEEREKQLETAVTLERFEQERKRHEEEMKNVEIEFTVKDDKIAELFIENESAMAECANAKQELEMVMAETETRLKNLEEEIKWLKDAKKSSEAAREETEENAGMLKRELEEKEKEVEGLEAEVARISMELAMLKAETDELRGSKSQRAAEAAALDAGANEKLVALTKELEKTQADFAALQEQNISHLEAQSALQQTAAQLTQQNNVLKQQLAELEAKQDRTPPLPTPPMESLELEARCQTLQNELAQTLAEFELLTKASLEHEHERRALEGTLDALRDRLESTETALNEERIRTLGSSTNGSISGPVESRSTTVLKTEFKKMMRDMRSEQARQLRAEQEERRKLEATIRGLKKEMMGSRRQTTMSMAERVRERLDREVPPTPTIREGGGFPPLPSPPMPGQGN